MNRFERHRKKTIATIWVVGLVSCIALIETTLQLVGGLATDSGGPGRYVRLREWQPDRTLTFRAPPTRVSADDGATALYVLQTDGDGLIKPGRFHESPDLTVAFLGGSTTETLFVDAERRFHVVAARRLEEMTGRRVNALNAARSGNNVMHANHILSAKLLPLRPDYVVLMEAVNDMGVLLRFGDYWPAADRDFGHIQPHPVSVVAGFRQIRDALIPQTYIAMRQVAKFIRAGGRPAHAATREKVEDKSAAVLRGYESALRQFIATCRAWDVRPVLMTQALRPVANPGIPGLAGAYLDAENLRSRGQSVQSVSDLHVEMNEVARRLAAELDVLLIDLPRSLPGDPDLFYDGMHYGNRGSQVVGGIVGDSLAADLRARPR